MKTTLAALFLLLFTACSKEDTNIVILNLPAKTQSGQNTFGFILNKTTWTNYGQVCAAGYDCRPNLTGNFDQNTGSVVLHADKVMVWKDAWKTQEEMSIHLETSLKGDILYNALTDLIKIQYTITENGQSEKIYILPANNPEFKMLITKTDVTNKIVSGEFYGKLFRRGADAALTIASDSVLVNEGRFDIRF